MNKSEMIKALEEGMDSEAVRLVAIELLSRSYDGTWVSTARLLIEALKLRDNCDE